VIALLYLVLALAALVLARWAKSWQCAYLAGLMVFSCVGSNIAVYEVGYERAPLLIPEWDAVIAVAVAGVAVAARSRLAVLVLAGFFVEGAAVIGFYLNHQQGSHSYYATMNVIYAAQVLMIGGSGVAFGLASRLNRIDHSLRGYLLGW